MANWRIKRRVDDGGGGGSKLCEQRSIPALGSAELGVLKVSHCKSASRLLWLDVGLTVRVMLATLRPAAEERISQMERQDHLL